MSKLYVIHPVTQPMAETSASEAAGSVTQPMAETTGTGTPSCEEGSLDVDGQGCMDYVAAVVQYLETLHEQALVSGKPLAVELALVLEPLGDKERIRELMREKIPWSPQKYFAFQSVPQTAKKSIVHVTFLDYAAESYHGQGIYLHDTVMLLKSMKLSTLLAKTVELRPKPAGRPAAFGWQADGAMINSALCFALTSLAAYAVLHPDVVFPQPLARLWVTSLRFIRSTTPPRHVS
jgi:hypothetical protein